MKLTKAKLKKIIQEELENISNTGRGSKRGSARHDVHDTMTGLGRLSTDTDKLDPQFQAVFDALSPEAQRIAIFDDDNNFNDIVITNPTGAWRLAKINFRDGKYYLDSPIEKGHMRWSEKELVDPAQVAQMIEEIL
jgi:hypothetical protein